MIQPRNPPRYAGFNQTSSPRFPHSSDALARIADHNIHRLDVLLPWNWAAEMERRKVWCCPRQTKQRRARSTWVDGQRGVCQTPQKTLESAHRIFWVQ